MKPVFSKPVFTLQLVAVSALLAGCTMQMGGDDLNRRRDRITPSSSCGALDQTSCSANPACELTRAVCPGCEAAGNCASTTCLSCRDKPPQHSACGGLNETQCNADPLCRANYTEMACPAVMPMDGGPSEDCPRMYDGCSVNLPPQDPCAGQPESLCNAPFCRPIYGAGFPIACDPSGNCNSVPPPAYLGCEINITSCDTNCDCAVNEYCRMELMLPEPTGPVVTADGGTSASRCMAAPLPVGVCTRVPGLGAPVDPDIQDGGGAPTSP